MLPTRLAAAALTTATALLLVITGTVTALTHLGGDDPPILGCDAGHESAKLGLSAEQTRNAAIITTVAVSLRLPPRAAVIAIATAKQESDLRNLPGGDRDSIGLFQQRPSQGWGTPTQLHDPIYASSAFYHALARVPGWQTMRLTDAAQAVQHSGTPHAYAQWESLATQIVTALLGKPCPVENPPGRAAQRAVSYALAQIGLPYQWGGDGPGKGDRGFDCSGLTQAAYQAAGIRLPRVAQDQYGRGPRLPAGIPLAPGDLVFFGRGSAEVDHVGIYLGHSIMIDAPHTGARVRREPVPHTHYIGATRPAA